MKRVLTLFAGLLFAVSFVSSAVAGAIDNKTNWSAEYIRTLNRNAATDFADIAAYNPAGTVKLHEGLTINGSVQYLKKDYTNKITHPLLGGTQKYESDEPSYVPGLFAVYNKNRWALFGSVTVVAGGGKVDFGDGDASTFSAAGGTIGQPLCPYGMAKCAYFDPASQKLTAESFYLGYTVGTAFKLNDLFSFSMGLRYVNAHKELDASVTLYDADNNPFPTSISFDQDGDGWGGIFGIGINPDYFNIITDRFEAE